MYTNSNKPQELMTATPSKYPQGRFKDKPCKCCGTMFSPKAPSHLYCSQQCQDDGWSSNYLKNAYGIDHNTYKKMEESQNSLCAICGTPGFTMREHHWKKLVVDHDHKTGVVRGLLCHNCNRALGLLKDDPEVIKNAVKYLEGATTIS